MLALNARTSRSSCEVSHSFMSLTSGEYTTKVAVQSRATSEQNAAWLLKALLPPKPTFFGKLDGEYFLRGGSGARRSLWLIGASIDQCNTSQPQSGHLGRQTSVLASLCAMGVFASFRTGANRRAAYCRRDSRTAAHLGLEGGPWPRQDVNPVLKCQLLQLLRA